MPTETSSRGVRIRPRSRAAAQIAGPRAPTDEEIRQRAYEIYLARGSAPGNPDWDWQQAELELRARLALLGKP